MADITAGGSVITDWTAVAQNTIVHSDILDISDDLEAQLLLQAFLDSETAHTGTRIIVEISHNTSGDEDWVELQGAERTILIGTANAELIDDNPLTAGSTTILMSSTTGFTVDGLWRGIKDGTIGSSELVRQTSETTNTNITVLDGTTNEHANTVNVYSIAMSAVIALLTASVRRVRIVVDNTYDPDGSTLVYRLMITRALDIE
jgi:hypothetical protein